MRRIGLWCVLLWIGGCTDPIKGGEGDTSDARTTDADADTDTDTDADADMGADDVDTDTDTDSDADADTDTDTDADTDTDSGLDTGFDPSVDSDGDGVSDPDDPFPRDPFPEYMVTRNEAGTIDVQLSNRDGTFGDVTQIGDTYGGTGDAAYRYVRFVVSDFNGDGQTDFIAIGDATPDDSSDAYDLWWFWRAAHSTGFSQRLLGTHDRNPIRGTGDLDNDHLVDLISLEKNSGYITEAALWFYGNQRLVETATCFSTTDPDNPDGCAFVETEAIDLTPWASGMWGLNISRDAVDVNGDGNRDMAVYRYASGGDSSAPVAILAGAGDGTFDPIDFGVYMFEHSSGPCGSSPTNMALFADFDGNGVGDLLLGLDDDGDAGSAWFYPGDISEGYYTFDLSGCFEAFDLSPGYESGSEHPGVGHNTWNFDLDFDGIQDVISGYNYTAPWDPPSRIVWMRGQGDGRFDDPVTIREFPLDDNGLRFAIPRRICARFPSVE
jgi:hypothetical protein